MPKLDHCHYQIVHALEKAGWIVQSKPYALYLDRVRRLHIDIEAHHQQQNGRSTIMVVEVKCFQDTETETTDLYIAIGQYIVYRELLEEKGIDIPLYLAIPKTAYDGVFQRMAVSVISKNRIKILVVDLELETINQWIP